jgi:hypothetical protein
MFEQLLQMVTSQGQQAVVQNPAVPNEHNDAVLHETTNSITDTLKGLLGGGGNTAAQVLNLFSPQNANANLSNHPVSHAISGNLVNSLMNKFGIGGQQAGGIASMLIPMVLSKLVGGANNNAAAGGGGLNIASIFNSLSGGNTSGLNIGNIVSQFGGNALDKNHDGKVDLQDLVAAFSGAGQQQQAQQPQQPTQEGGGGIMDALTGLFKG